jgi:hypothetical protein
MLDMMAPDTSLPVELQEPLLVDATAEPSRQAIVEELTQSLADAGVSAADIPTQVDLMLDMMAPDTGSTSPSYPDLSRPQ